jgi:alginate export protein
MFNLTTFTKSSMVFSLLVLLIFLIQATQFAGAEEHNSEIRVVENLSDQHSLLNTQVEFGFRARYEQVEKEPSSAHAEPTHTSAAHANTAKFRLHTKTTFNEHWQVELELDHVQAFAKAHHSDGVIANGNPVIADPEGTELNEVFLDAIYDQLLIRLGRQKIAYSEQRFIGSVDFRQNDQTFDALAFKINLLTSSQLDYAFINNVNRIFGDDASSQLSPIDPRFQNLAGVRPPSLRGNHKVRGHLFNFSVKEWNHVELNSYLYDVNNQTETSFSNKTHGLRAEYRNKLGKTLLFSNIEFAAQKQQESHVDDWIGYSMFELGARHKSFQLGIMQERLNEKDGVAFITPLATLHKYQGWTDQFLATPSVGLSDQQIRFQWKRRPVIIDLRYHRFHSLRTNTAIGSEVDIDLVYAPSRLHELRLRIAEFKPESEQTIIPNSTTKIFFMYAYNL